MYAPSVDGPLRQSEILSSLVQHVLTLDSVGTTAPQVQGLHHPFAIIASQDCDLEQEYNGRAAGKVTPLPAILFYEVVTAAQLMSQLIGSEMRKRVVNNNDERYHVLQRIEPAQDAAAEGLPALGIDFKRYFTIPTAEVYKQLATAKRRCVMESPYLEHFAARASRFQCRVALPVEYDVTLSNLAEK